MAYVPGCPLSLGYRWQYGPISRPSIIPNQRSKLNRKFNVLQLVGGPNAALLRQLPADFAHDNRSNSVLLPSLEPAVVKSNCKAGALSTRLRIFHRSCHSPSRFKPARVESCRYIFVSHTTTERIRVIEHMITNATIHSDYPRSSKQ